MSLIQKSAYLEVCPKCGEHADIVLADGRRVCGLTSKVRIVAMLELMKNLGDICRAEYVALVEQVANCKLPDLSSVAELDCAKPEAPESAEKKQVTLLLLLPKPESAKQGSRYLQ